MEETLSDEAIAKIFVKDPSRKREVFYRKKGIIWATIPVSM